MAVRLRCKLGEFLGEECDDLTISKVTQEENELLRLRTGHNVVEVCSRHRASYIQFYSWRQIKCCDPLRYHPAKAMTRSLRVITTAMADRWSTATMKLVPGQKLCTLCRKDLSLLSKRSSIAGDGGGDGGDGESGDGGDGGDGEGGDGDGESGDGGGDGGGDSEGGDGEYGDGKGGDGEGGDGEGGGGDGEGGDGEGGDGEGSDGEGSDSEGGDGEGGDDGDSQVDDVCTHVSNLLACVGKSPINMRKMARTKKYSDQKMKTIDETIRKSLKMEPSKVEVEYNEIMDSLKKKFNNCLKKSEKVQVLTIIPQSWPIRQIKTEFGTTYHMASLSKQLVATKGILATPNVRPGKVLDTVVEKKVIEFYLNDNVSRMMPGKKDYVSMLVEGKREHVQKRLLLFNLKDAHGQFLDENVGLKVSLAKFKELRPKNVILAGASGTHNVCVCTIHQNVKLMVEGAKILTLEDLRDKFGSSDGEITYKHLLANLICNPAQPECHLGSCQLCRISEDPIHCSYCVESANDKCHLCQKVEIMKKALLEALDAEGVDEVSFKAWVSVDHTTLETITQSTDEFVDSLIEKLLKLRWHDFIAKEQASFLMDLKSHISNQEVIVQGDFAENYSFIVQDAAQGFHWNNDQATIHPFVVYFNGNDRKINPEQGTCCLNFVIISDSLVHNAVSVHCFIKKLLTFLRVNIDVKKVFYFSDGASAQYKNKKNFVNLAFHSKDFKMEAEWHFFATAHGKGPCDGLGGTVKRLAARASLQRPLDDQIQTPLQLFEWAKVAIPSATFEYVTKAEVLAEELLLQVRLEDASTIEGTHSFHAFIPVDGSTGKLRVKVYSRSQSFDVAKVSNHRDPIAIDGLKDYVICVYDGVWWLALVMETYPSSKEAKLKFLHPKGPSPSFKFPKTDDVLIVGCTNILMKANPTIPTGRVYKLDNAEIEEA